MSNWTKIIGKEHEITKLPSFSTASSTGRPPWNAEKWEPLPCHSLLSSGNSSLVSSCLGCLPGPSVNCSAVACTEFLLSVTWSFWISYSTIIGSRPPPVSSVLTPPLPNNLGSGYIPLLKVSRTSLAGVAQWIECPLAHQRVAGPIPSLGHTPGLWVRSPVGGAQEKTTHWCFSPSISPSLPFSRNK